MIKKILTMSAGVVLGSMISTASFAHDYEPTEDCLNARDNHHLCMNAVQTCKAEGCEKLAPLRYCKRLSMRLVNAVCTDGTYDNPIAPYVKPPHDYMYDLHDMFGPGYDPENPEAPADTPDGYGDCRNICAKYSK